MKSHEDRYIRNQMESESQIECQDKFNSSSTFGSSLYQMKTIKVFWEENENAFMHVFINLTSMKKLEKEKATNKCLHIMFSSVSHEFRTPINAFTSALTLLHANTERLKNIENGLSKANPGLKKQL